MKITIAYIITICLLITSCGLPIRTITVRGSGNIVNETRQIKGISKVELATIGTLMVMEDEEESLEVTGEDNILPYLLTVVRGGNLVIEFQEGVNVLPSKDLGYTLKVKEVKGISATSAGSIQAEAITTDDFSIDVSSAGSILIGQAQVKNLQVWISSAGGVKIEQLRGDYLEVNLSSSGSFTATGTVGEQRVNISSSGSYQGGDLESSEAIVNISSSGNAQIWVNESLDVDLSSSGDLEYYGDPQLSQRTSSSGKVISLGSH